ncbi:MAG: anti-sigma factor [Phycisphaerae bacterium]
MQCDEVQELIYLEAAGAADSTTRSVIRDHLAKGCITCQATLSEATAAAAQIPLNLPPCPPSESLKTELMRRVKTATPLPQSGRTSVVPEPKRTPRKLLLWPLVISTSLAAAMFLVAIFGLQANETLRREHLKDLTALASLQKSFIRDTARLNRLSNQMHDAVAMEKRKILSLETKLAAAESLKAMIGSPALEMASLHGSSPMRTAWGRVMWNDKMKIWKLCVFNMPHLPKSKTYEVWMITTGGKKMPAGLFNTDYKTRSALVTPAVPPNKHEMAEIAVTIEPAGGSPQPTGAILLAGHIG